MLKGLIEYELLVAALQESCPKTQLGSIVIQYRINGGQKFAFLMSSKRLNLNEQTSCTGSEGTTSGQENEVSRSKRKLCIASFLFINRNDAEHKLDEKYSGSSFPYSATRISTACGEKPISILT